MNLIQKARNYLGNPNLKHVGVAQNLDETQVTEFIKCANNPVYFIENYVKIITLDKGFVKISLYPFQKEAITQINENRRVIIKAGRQVGKTTMVVGYILWYILFNEDKTVAILANKAQTSREILSRIKIAYESLPLWLQQGVRTWNKGDIELENNCRIMATSMHQVPSVVSPSHFCILMNLHSFQLISQMNSLHPFIPLSHPVHHLRF